MVTGRERRAPLIIFMYNYNAFSPQVLPVIDTRDTGKSVLRNNTEKLKAKRIHKSNKYLISLHTIEITVVYLG